MNWLMVLCYIFVVYGICNIIAFGEGPGKIFEHIRVLAYHYFNGLYRMLTCMMCLPANVGWVLSLFNWFVVPTIAFTPFNILFAGTSLWWLAALFDGALTSAIVWLIYRLDSYFEKDEGEENNQLLND